MMDADLVLEGGGVRGSALAGAVIALDEAGYRFRRVAGASSGAIAAALICALKTAGEPVSRLKDIMDSVDFSEFIKRAPLGDIGLAERLVVREGLYDGNYLIEWLGSHLERIGITKFSQLRDSDPGQDASLSDSQRYTLVVCVTDITRRKLARLPWDYHAYGLVPDDQLIVDAVRASMSFPLFFEPVKITCAAAEVDDMSYPGETVTWIDGGILSDFPVDIFDRADGEPNRWPTIGVKLTARGSTILPDINRGGLPGYLVSCLDALLNNADRYYVDPEKESRTIFIDTGAISSLDFHLAPQQMQTLFESGQQAARSFMKSQPALR